MKKDIEFDIEVALKALKDGKGLTGKDGVMTPLIRGCSKFYISIKLDRSKCFLSISIRL